MKFNQLILRSILLLTLISCSSYDNVKNMCSGQIVFEYREQELANSSSVYIIKPDGSDVLKITPEGAFDAYPVWSPDGQKLAFLSRDNLSYASQRLFVSQSDGTVRKNLSGSVWAWGPIWSPDSKMIVFASNNVDGSTTDLYLVNADGTQLRRLTYSGELQKETNVQLGWSPDSRKVFFSAARKGSSISLDVININGENQVRVVDSKEGYTDFTLSPDSLKILARDPSDTFLINTNGLHRKKLKLDYQNPGISLWSPNSSQIAFSRIYDPNVNFFVVNINSLNISFDNLPKLGMPNHLALRPVAWSPDGQKVLYLAYDSINIVDLKSEKNSIVWHRKPSLKTPYQPSYAALTTAAWQPLPCR